MANTVATVSSGNESIDALLSDRRWINGGVLTYSFPATGAFGGVPGNGNWNGYSPGEEPYDNFQQLNATQRALATSVFDQVASFTLLTFENLGVVATDESTFRFGMTDGAETAHAYTPDDHPAGGDVWFNNSSGDFDAPVRGDYAYVAFLHEIGHALGLLHPHENEYYGLGELQYDNHDYSVMSYRSYFNMDLDEPYPNGDYGFPQTYMMYDIAALQHMYGANFTSNAGNTVYAWNPSGLMTTDGGAGTQAGDDTIFMTVWDGGGIDTYDFSTYSNSLQVNLNPGAWTITATGQLADLGDGRRADGNIANALLYQGNLASLIENAIGGSAGDSLIGNQAANVLTGNGGDDVLDGRAGADTLDGGSGDDRFLIDDSGDSIVEAAGAGYDRAEVVASTFVLGANVEQMTGLSTSGAQHLTGNGSDNEIFANNFDGNVLLGLGGADRILGGDGTDQIEGGDGNDIIEGRGDADQVDGGAGADFITGGAGTDQILGGAGDDLLFGHADADVIDGGADNDTINGDAGADVLRGGAGTDTIRGSHHGDVIEGGDGDDLIEGNGHGDTIRGDDGNDQLYADTPLTIDPPLAVDFEGEDVLIGGAGADQIHAGAGADRIVYLAASESTDAALDRVRAFQSGTDRIDLTALQVSSVSWTEHVDPADGSFYSLVTVATPGATMKIRVDAHLVQADFLLPASQPPIVGGEGDDLLDGTANADVILGNGGNDVLNGLGQDDRLEGGLGNDTLDGGAGVDDLRGGAGDDLYLVDAVGDIVTELAGEGTDAVHTGLASYSLGANVENLTGLGGGSHTLAGNDAANILDGGLGADAMAGGLGDDVYLVDNGGDSVSEGANAGNDEIRTGLLVYNMSGTANVERLTGTSSSGQVLTGNGLANVIVAGSGNDSLDGGAGADSMAGGVGNDIYVVDNGLDVVTEATGEGNDEIRTALAAFSLAGIANVEYLVGTSTSAQTLTGNGLANAILGGSGNDLIDGGVGGDAMFGGLGDDVYLVDDLGDTVNENASQGLDEVRTSLASFSLAGLTNVENLTGGAGDQTLTGNGLANAIAGGAGNDLVDGGLGADSMAGGLGNDVYILDNAGDSVTELAGQGSDEVRTALASFSIAALANIENLTGTSGAGQTLTGNGSNNVIAAGAGNDVIDGGLGADSMAGGLGNDTFFVDSLGDSVVELGGGGTDEVRTALAAYALAGEVERLTGTTNAGQALTGNGLANLIMAGWGNDVIDGGLGADDMRGSLGNDVYLVDNAGDTVTEGDSQGLDEVRTNLATYSLAGVGHVENLTGGAGDQSLTGNGHNNIIDGGLGADTMAGGGGHDVYIVDNLGDTIIEVDGAGTDEVRTGLGSKAPPERAVYVLPAFIENLTGTSAGAQGVRDNALSNVITMGVGHDLVVADAGGIDTINAGIGNDFVYYGDKLTAADITNGGAGSDTIALLGNYGSGITFTAANLVGVERMALYTSLYLPGTGPNNYNITMNDANVAAGTEFFVTAASLQSNESLTFSGAAETDGRFTIHGGGGADTITGGAGGDFVLGNAGNDILFGLGGVDFLIGGLGADQMHGGAGVDRFVYQSAAQSTTGSVDQILDFQHGDRIDLTGIDANANAGDGNSAFTFIGSDAFHNVAGELRAYQSGADWFVEGDTNGDGLADLVIQVTLPDATPLAAGDFIL